MGIEPRREIASCEKAPLQRLRRALLRESGGDRVMAQAFKPPTANKSSVA